MLFPLFILFFKLSSNFRMSISFYVFLIDSRLKSAFFHFLLSLLLLFSFPPFLLFIQMMHIQGIKIYWPNFWNRFRARLLRLLDFFLFELMLSGYFCINQRFEMIYHLLALLGCQRLFITWFYLNIWVQISTFKIAFNNE